MKYLKKICILFWLLIGLVYIFVGKPITLTDLIIYILLPVIYMIYTYLVFGIYPKDSRVTA